LVYLGPSGHIFLKTLRVIYSKASGFIGKASGFYSMGSWVLFERLLGWFTGALRALFFKTLRLFYSKASGFIGKASGFYSMGSWVLFERLLGWFTGALRALFFKRRSALSIRRLLGLSEKPLGFIRWTLGFYSRGFWVGLRRPFGPFFFKDAPPVLFEGFWVYRKSSWVLFDKLLGSI